MEYFNLTIPQQNIWNLQKYYENTAVANICGAVFYREERDVVLLCRALNLVIKRQSALRLRFVKVNSEIKQYVENYIHEDIPIKEFASQENFEQYAREVASVPLGMLCQKLYKFEIVRIGERLGILAVLSHMISDAWTFSLIVTETDRIYGNLLTGENSTEEVADYINYIMSEKEYLRSGQFQRDEAYWREQYSIKPDKVSIQVNLSMSDSIKANRIIKSVSPRLSGKIKKHCEDYVVSPAVLFETALNIYLSKLNPDCNRITIGFPILNRTKAWEKKTAGMFISTVPLTVEIAEENTVGQLEQKITRTHIQIFRHQKYPYSMILENLRKDQNFEGNLYDVMFSFQNARTGTDTMTMWFCNGYSEVPFALHVDDRDANNVYQMTVDYQLSVFRNEKEVKSILDRLEYILWQIIESRDLLIKDVSIATEMEKRRILFEFNETAVDYPKDKCVHELFMEQVTRKPEEIAVVFEEEEVTYRKLDEMSNILAHMLREKGAGRGDIIPIIAKRSWHIFVAMLGILKAGGAYMPVSPEYPKDRVQFIIDEAGSRIGCVFGYDEHLKGIEMFNLDELCVKQTEAGQRLPVENWNTSEDVCYVIFTSGSTGVPKGVMVKHGNVSNYCYDNDNNVCHALVKKEYKKIISVTNVVFDIFVTESLLPLLNGMTVYMTTDEEVSSQKAINRIITENGVEVLQTTPTKMRWYLFDRDQRGYLSVLKSIFLGGEALTADLYEKLRKKTKAEIFNIYGPAETTVWSSYACVRNTDITIGRPIANTQIYILDRYNNPVPVGVPGELCIAGEGVGLGYLNRPDLTAERFVPNPFATEENSHGKIMYRTGDLAVWRDNREVEYLGRIDTQVKIRGLRIELGEIESVMSQFPGIRMCAVTDRTDEENRQYLAGYYTTSTDGKANRSVVTALKIDEEELRKYLSSKLPKYMVPNYFMHLSELPMTPSGKLDRKNLPIPKAKMVELTEYVQPSTEIEKKLCQIMENVLGFEPIGLRHDFFACGGDSLKAMEFIVRAEEQQIKIKLQDIFDHPTVEEMVKTFSQNQRREKYNRETFQKYESLLSRNRIYERYEQQEFPVKTALLSGITGFLGAHIADELLKDPECIVYCLVRNRDSDNRGRLSQILEYYFGDKYADAIGTRIIPVVGDIIDEKLSYELPEKVDVVIHAAATVKHYGSYEYFYKVNTLGTKHMADYALRTGARFVHISTISVSGNSLADNFETEIALEERHFGESCLYQGQSLENVYVRSKFEAECVVLDAMLRGLQANIIRVGNLTNRSWDYVFQPNYMENAFLSRIKAALEMGCLPDYMLSLYGEFSPVDDTADAIVRIARHFNMQHTIFHVYSDRNLYFDRMLEILKQLSVDMQVVNGETFTRRLKETVSQGRAYIYEAFLNDMDSNGRINYETNIHIENAFTLSYLKQLGFEWTKIDYEYMKGYLEYFKRLGYLEID